VNDASLQRVDVVLSALADPTRRALLERLAASGAASATELARSFPVSRQALARHLSTLDAAGLVERERRGREARYSVNAAPLTEVLAWMAGVGAAWDRRLTALGRLLEDEGA
jgi:DNA-binding transcriptional ArsR family regulator